MGIRLSSLSTWTIFWFTLETLLFWPVSLVFPTCLHLYSVIIRFIFASSIYIDSFLLVSIHYIVHIFLQKKFNNCQTLTRYKTLQHRTASALEISAPWEASYHINTSVIPREIQIRARRKKLKGNGSNLNITGKQEIHCQASWNCYFYKLKWSSINYFIWLNVIKWRRWEI